MCRLQRPIRPIQDRLMPRPLRLSEFISPCKHDSILYTVIEISVELQQSYGRQLNTYNSHFWRLQIPFTLFTIVHLGSLRSCACVRHAQKGLTFLVWLHTDHFSNKERCGVPSFLSYNEMRGIRRGL